MIALENVQLPCDHIKNGVACCLTLNLSTITCEVLVTKHVSSCKHDIVVKCSLDVTKENFKCPSPCQASLLCGHPCPGSCSRCSATSADGKPIVKHVGCKVPCGRKAATCSHNCSRACHYGKVCGLCQQPCEVSCFASDRLVILTVCRFVVSIQNAHRSVMSLARLASNLASGPVNIRASALCHVLLRATAYNAMSGAPSSFLVVTAVQAYAARTVPPIVVSSAV